MRMVKRNAARPARRDTLHWFEFQSGFAAQFVASHFDNKKEEARLQARRDVYTRNQQGGGETGATRGGARRSFAQPAINGPGALIGGNGACHFRSAVRITTMAVLSPGRTPSCRSIVDASHAFSALHLHWRSSATTAGHSRTRHDRFASSFPFRQAELSTLSVDRGQKRSNHCSALSRSKISEAAAHLWERRR